MFNNHSSGWGRLAHRTASDRVKLRHWTRAKTGQLISVGTILHVEDALSFLERLLENLPL